MEKVLVTGASGMLGSRICFDLAKRGFSVTALLTAKEKKEPLKNYFKIYGDETLIDALELVFGDLLNPDDLFEACANKNSVIHCAALVSFHKKDRQKLRAVNVSGTRNLVNAALQMGVSHFVHVSSVAAISASQPFKIKKPFLLGLRTPYSYYGLTKYRSELEVWRGREEGLNVLIARPSLIIGPGNWKSGSSALIGRVAKGMRFVSPGTTGFIDVRDASSALVLLLIEKRSDQIIVVNGWNESYKNFFSKLAVLVQAPEPKWIAGRAIANIMYKLEHLFELLTGRKALLTKETVESAFSLKSYDVNLPELISGFTYTKKEDTVKWIAGIYLKQEA